MDIGKWNAAPPLVLGVEKLRKYSFEKLEVWREAISLTKDIYIVSNNFPKEEMFGLTSQIRRAVVSISSNIAEGSSRTSLKDQARFTEISYGSLMEVLNQLILANELKYVNEEKYVSLREKIEDLSTKVNSLKISQKRRQNG